MFELVRFSGHRFEKGCLNASRSAQPPQHARQSEYQLALHGRFSVVVGNHRSFEGLVIFAILERRNDGLGREAVAYGIAARTAFTFWCCWSSAFQRIAAVGFDLFERAHRGPGGTIGFVSLSGGASIAVAAAPVFGRVCSQSPLAISRALIFRLSHQATSLPA